MMIVVPFHHDHLKTLNLQIAQREALSILSDAIIGDLERGQSFTALVEDIPMICCGVYSDGMGRGVLWALVSQDIGRHLVKVTKLCSQFFDNSGYRRLETMVDCNFKAGHRWVRLLGFEMEAERMRSYYPNGKDCSLYAKIY